MLLLQMPDKSLNHGTPRVLDSFKSQFCGFAAEKYSTKPQHKKYRLARP